VLADRVRADRGYPRARLRLAGHRPGDRRLDIRLHRPRPDLRRDRAACSRDGGAEQRHLRAAPGVHGGERGRQRAAGLDAGDLGANPAHARDPRRPGDRRRRLAEPRLGPDPDRACDRRRLHGRRLLRFAADGAFEPPQRLDSDRLMRARELNWMQVEEYLARDDRVVLPIGSTEQHGYLSLATDLILAERVSLEAAERLGVPVMPVLPFGVAPGFTAYPGTVSLRLDTLVAVLR